MAPDGSPFRPLYDDKIMFNGQPIALVVAETSEIARFAASLVRVEYESEAHVTDVFRQRDAAVPVKATSPEGAMFAPPKPRGDAAKALAAAAVRHDGRVLCPDRAPQPDGALRRDGHRRGRRQVHGIRQDPGRAERATLSVRRVRHEARGCARHVAVHGRRVRLRAASAVRGGAGHAGGAGAAALRPGGADSAADVRVGLSTRDDSAHRARRHDRRNAGGDHARCDHRDLAIRRLLSAGDGLVRPALQMRKREVRAPARSPGSADLVRHARAERGAWRVCARIRDGRARGRAQARSRRIAFAVLLGPRPA